MRTHVNFKCVNEIEVMYERQGVNVKVERGSTFTYTLDLPYNISIFFKGIRFTSIRKEKLRVSGNLPLLEPASYENDRIS